MIEDIEQIIHIYNNKNKKIGTFYFAKDIGIRIPKFEIENCIYDYYKLYKKMKLNTPYYMIQEKPYLINIGTIILTHNSLKINYAGATSSPK